MTVTVSQVMQILQLAYPLELAESWDTGIGLTCGDPAGVVTKILLAVDIDEAVVAQAVGIGAELLVTHHPLLFHPVQRVATDTVKGILVHTLIAAGIAHYAAHTNADKAVGGVNDALAGALGLLRIRPLDPVTSLGRIGDLPRAMTLRAFAELAARALPMTVSGVRAAGDPARRIEVVALSSGAGDSQLQSAMTAGVDVFLTSDLRHHVVSEQLAHSGSPAIVEVAHWAGEWPWLARAAEVIELSVVELGEAGSLTTIVSELRTDPWTIRI